MLKTELIEHNLVVYNDNIDYLNALLNLGWGVLAVRTHNNVWNGLQIFYKESNKNLAYILELNHLELHSLKEYNIKLKDIMFIPDLNWSSFSHNTYYNISYIFDDKIQSLIPSIPIYCIT